MKTKIRKITTALLALTVALPSAATQIPTLSTAAQPAAPAKAAPQPAAVTEEAAAPAVTTVPDAAYTPIAAACGLPSGVSRPTEAAPAIDESLLNWKSNLYAGAPEATLKDQEIECALHEEIEIHIPYLSENQAPLYDTFISLWSEKALNTNNQRTFLKNGYFDFTDTEIIYHCTPYVTGEWELTFREKKEPGKADLNFFTFRLNIKDTGTEEPQEDSYSNPYQPVKQISFNPNNPAECNQRIPYPQVTGDDGKKHPYYNVQFYTYDCENTPIEPYECYSRDAIVIEHLGEFLDYYQALYGIDASIIYYMRAPQIKYSVRYDFSLSEYYQGENTLPYDYNWYTDCCFYTTTSCEESGGNYFGTDHCVTGEWLDDSASTTTTTTTTTAISGMEKYHWHLSRDERCYDPFCPYNTVQETLKFDTDSIKPLRVGEKLDLSGVTFKGTVRKNDGTETTLYYERLSDYKYTIFDSTFDSSKPGQYGFMVIVEADGWKAMGGINAEVYGADDIIYTTTTTSYDGYRDLSSGSITKFAGQKQTYQLGETLDLGNIRVNASGNLHIIAGTGGEYNESSSFSVTDQPLDKCYYYKVLYTDFNSKKPGTYTVRILAGIPADGHCVDCEGSFKVKVVNDAVTTKTTQTDTTETTCTTEENWYDPGMGYLELYGIPKTVYQIGEELDLSGIKYNAYGETSLGYSTGVRWEVSDQLLDEAEYKVDDSEFDNTKPGTYTITIVLTAYYVTGYSLAKGSFEVQVVAGTKGSDSQTTATVTTTTEDPWDAIMCEGTNHCDEAFWLDGAAEVFNYDGAPNSAERSIYCHINDEIEISLPYKSKNHKPMYDTNISVSLSEDIQDSYFEFTDTAIIWHGTVTAVGNHDVIFNIESETGIGWNNIDFIVYAFECRTSVTTETVTVETTTQPAETRPHYTGSEAFTTQLTFNETRKTVTIPYPQIKQQNRPEYCVDVFDETGKCINNSVRFNKDSLVIKDVTEFFKEGAEKVLYLTVKSRTGSYTADYIITEEDDKGEYVPQHFLPETGDINNDNKHDVKDAVVLARVCAGDSSIQLTDAMQKQADVNGDTKVNSYDLTILLRKLARLI